MQPRALYPFFTRNSIPSCERIQLRSFATKLKKQKRGSRQMIRNIEAARLAATHSPGTAGGSSSNPIPTAFFALVVFPLVATGTLVVARQDLRQDFKDTFPLLFKAGGDS